MLEVCEDVVFVDFFEALNPCVFGLSTDTVAFEYTHVEITAYYACVEVLASKGDTTSTDEGVVDKVSWLDFCLVCHKESDLMVC